MKNRSQLECRKAISPQDPAEVARKYAQIQKRTLDRLSRLSPQDAAEMARKYEADSLRQLTRIIETGSNQHTTTER